MLRDYQEEIVQDLVGSDDNAIVVLPTGGGKSHIIQQVVHRDREHKYAVVVRNEPLVAQLIQRMEELHMKVGVIKAGYNYDNSEVNNYDVLLIMEQTFDSRKDKLKLPKIDVILKDEFHIAYAGNQFATIKKYLEPSRIIGLTATPITEIGIGIHKTEEAKGYRLINDISTASLISRGYLVKPIYKLPRNSVLHALKKVKISNGDYATGELDAILNTVEHNNFVVDEIMMHCSNRKALVFANSIAHVEALAQVFSERGIDVAYLHSKMNKEDRATNMGLYMSGAVRVMINMSILTTGFDDPATDAIVYVRPTKVLRLYIQIGGRGLRIMDGKDNCLVLDLAGMLQEHGFIEADRSFDAADKNEMLEEKDKSQVENLDAMITEGENEISSETELKYKLYDRDKRMDALWNENQILSAQVEDYQREHFELEAAKETIKELRAINKNISNRLALFADESEARNKRQAEFDRETAAINLRAAKEAREMAREVNRAKVIQNISRPQGEALDDTLRELKEAVYSSRTTLKGKITAAASAYELLGRDTLTLEDIDTLVSSAENSLCPYIIKSIDTRLKHLIESRKSLNSLFGFISFVEKEYEKVA